MLYFTLHPFLLHQNTHGDLNPVVQYLYSCNETNNLGSAICCKGFDSWRYSSWESILDARNAGLLSFNAQHQITDEI